MVRQREHFISRSDEGSPNVSEAKKTSLESAPYPNRRSQAADLQTARLVYNALVWSPFLEDITVNVTAVNGTVILAGVSPYRSLGRMAAMIAYTIPGVRQVIDNIRIGTSA